MRSSSWFTFAILDLDSANFCTYGAKAGILLTSANFLSSVRGKREGWVSQEAEESEREIPSPFSSFVARSYRLEVRLFGWKVRFGWTQRS